MDKLMPWSEEKFLEEIRISMKRVEDSELFAKLVEDMERYKILETLLENFKCSNASTSSQSIPFGSSISEDDSLQQKRNKTVARSRSRNQHGRDQNSVVLVVLGVGSLYLEKPRLQLSLALLIKSRFPHLINRISVFDPVLSDVEYQVLTALGCADIEENERLRKLIHVPTVFYLPHFPYFLVDALLENNIDPWRLGWITILGNSFSQAIAECLMRPRCLKALLKHVVEIPVIPACDNDDFRMAFRKQSWHLFPNREIELLTSEEMEKEIAEGRKPKIAFRFSRLEHEDHCSRDKLILAIHPSLPRV